MKDDHREGCQCYGCVCSRYELEIHSLTNDIEHKRETIAELRKDSDRIMWLCDSLFESMWNGVIDKGSKTHWRIAGDYRHTVAKMEGFYFRAAIDKAMEETK